MQIINFIKYNSLSSQQTNTESSLLHKVKNLIGNFLSFIHNHTSCIHSAKPVISKSTSARINLSDEILRVLDEEKSSQTNKKDLDFITFSFNEPIYDTPKDNEPIYDIPKNNEPIYDTPRSNEPVEPIYDIPKNNEPIYDTPRSNEPVEPIYEEIDDLCRRVNDRKISNDMPPPLPPRNQ